MNDIILSKKNLPANIDDLAKFALVGREKLVAVRAEIRAIDKVGLAEDVRRQKLEEAQAISEAVLDAEVRIGELMAQIPKATKGNGSNQYAKNDTAVDFSTAEEKPVTKSEIIKQAGFTQKQAERFQTLAAHPEIVEQAKVKARADGDIVSRAAVLNMVKSKTVVQEVQKRPHVAYNSGNNEWYTPKEIIETARDMMGGIDIDPASSEVANKVVKAECFYTVENDGLSKKWFGNVWLNPPYASDLIGKFADKLVSEFENYSQAVVLVNNATETEWFNKIIGIGSAVCFPRGRVKFYKPDGSTGAPLQGQAIIYIGNCADKFIRRFNEIGWCANINDL